MKDKVKVILEWIEKDNQHKDQWKNVKIGNKWVTAKWCGQDCKWLIEDFFYLIDRGVNVLVHL